MHASRDDLTPCLLGATRARKLVGRWPRYNDDEDVFIAPVLATEGTTRGDDEYFYWKSKQSRPYLSESSRSHAISVR